jgi:peptidyl-prolyl cis-trans isomerase D
MLSSFRKLSKSKAGPIFAATFLLLILASFALADISNFSTGGNLSSGTLAKVGDVTLTEAEVQDVLDRQVQQLRQTNPEATRADLAGQFDEIVNALLQEKTMLAYGREHGFEISKRLVDAEIAKLPGARGLDGRFSDQAYAQFLQQQRLTDQQVRTEITKIILQRLMLAPVAANARIPVGVARPYASMLLESREGQVALVPTQLFASGQAPTEAELQRFYQQNQARYTVPEQRQLRIARVGPEQLGNITATEQEVTAYYNANQATYGGNEQRVISRAVVPDRAAAEQIAARARSGGTFAAAAAPAGFSAADVSVGPQTREQLAQLAGQQVAAQVFAAGSGGVVGPIQSDLGWSVVKVESINRAAGRSLEQARAEIEQRLTADKRKTALADLVTLVEDAVADGQSFSEVAQANRLPVLETPPLTAAGTAPSNPAFRLPTEYAQLPRFGFELEADDDPVVETLPNDAGYALLAVGETRPAAAAPFASIRDRVATDFAARRASDQARALANNVVAALNKGTPIADALRQTGRALPPAEALQVRRIQLQQFQGQVPAPLQMLFSLSAGKARLVAAPDGQGYFVVKLNRIVPGDASSQPSLIAQVQSDFNRASSAELAQQFVIAAQTDLGVQRNEAAIADAKKRLTAAQ